MHDFSEHFILNHIIWKNWSFYFIHDHHFSHLLDYMGKKKVGLCAAFCSIFVREKTPLRLPMQITWLWPPVGSFGHGLFTVRQKKKCEHNVLRLVFIYILFSTCQWVHIALAIKRPDILLIKIVMRNFTKLFLSNIINHGESDVQWHISV